MLERLLALWRLALFRGLAGLQCLGLFPALARLPVDRLCLVLLAP